MMLVTDSIILHLRRIEDNKEIIRICKSKDSQHNGQKKKYKRTKITHETKD